MRISRRLRLIGLVVATALAGVTQAGRAAPPARPNIVLIVTDDQGYGDMSVHGHPALKTPNLDRLHAESLRFTDFHVTPMCVYTRAQLMTSVHNLSSLKYTEGDELHLRADLLTLPEVLQRGGYRTALFGKWHLGTNVPHRPMDRGFQEAVWFKGPWMPAENYLDPSFYHGDTLRPHQGYCTDVLFDEAIGWIEARTRDNRAEPFFTYLATNVGHTPLVAPERYAAPFLAQGRSKADAHYLGMIQNLDDNMGRLEAVLEKTGLRANTLLVFLADNGGQSARGIYNAGMRGRKRQYYEGGHRVPLFVRWPAGGLSAPHDIAGLTEVRDLLPTLLELTGVAAPPGAKFEGVSLASALRSEKWQAPDRTLFIQYPSENPFENRRKGDAAVLSGRWRLVHDRELYDLDADPAQAKDVANRHPEIIARLRAAYAEWWSQIEPKLQFSWPAGKE